MTKKIAIIDMGTNTFHLLVAEVDEKGTYNVIHRERQAAKIGKGGINEGHITQEGLDRALGTLLSFKDTINHLGVQHTHAFGTSALRNAANQQTIIETIKKVTGIDPQIISGDVEAEYIYKGVRYSLSMGNEKSLIVDIGGGSVECIIGDDTHIYWKKSFEIGAQRLLEKFHKHDPITKEEISTLDLYFDDTLISLFEALVKFNVSTLIGASGTFDTLSDIFCYQQHIAKREEDAETPLSIPGFYAIYEALIGKSREQRMQISGMIEMRVDMIVVACCLVRYILSKHDFITLRVSAYSLKEGVLASLMEAK